MGRWSRRNRTLVSRIAAAFLVSFAALTNAYVWYENQQAEAEHKQLLADAEETAAMCKRTPCGTLEIARKQGLAEEMVRLGLDQAQFYAFAAPATSCRNPAEFTASSINPLRWEAHIKAASRLAASRQIIPGGGTRSAMNERGQDAGRRSGAAMRPISTWR